MVYRWRVEDLFDLCLLISFRWTSEEAERLVYDRGDVLPAHSRCVRFYTSYVTIYLQVVTGLLSANFQRCIRGKTLLDYGGLVTLCSSSPRPHYLANSVLDDCVNPQLYGSFLWMTFMSASRTYYPVVKFKSTSRGHAAEFTRLNVCNSLNKLTRNTRPLCGLLVVYR